MNVKSQIRFLIAISVGTVLAGIGCSSNSQLYYSGGGNRCDSSGSPLAAPVDQKVTPGSGYQKVSLDPNAHDPVLADGDYTYQSSAVFFFDNGADELTHTNMMVRLADTLNSTAPAGTSPTSVGVNCVRNVPVNLQTYTKSQTIVTHIVVDHGKQTIYTKILSVDFNPNHTFTAIATDEAAEPDGTTVDQVMNTAGIHGAQFFKVVSSSNNTISNFLLTGENSSKLDGLVQLQVLMQRNDVVNKNGTKQADVLAKALADKTKAFKEKRQKDKDKAEQNKH
jgi:hypothetical protein